MANTNITIRIDENLKKQAEDLFADLGLSMSSALIAFVRQSVREQRIPFVLSRNVLTAKSVGVIEEARKGINLSKPFTSVKDLMDDLNADD